MTNKLYFKINDAEPVQFADVPNGEKFTMQFSKFVTPEEYEELQKTGGQHFLISFQDKDGNRFSMFSIPKSDDK